MSLDWIYEWILAALPAYGADNILRAKSHYTIPSEPFITYQLIFLDSASFEFKSGDSDLYPDPDYTGEPPTPVGTFDRTYQQNCPMQIQIDCYSPNGAEDLRHLIAFANSDESIEIFNGAHVSLQSAGQIKNLAALADNDYRDRFMVSVDFMIALTRSEVKKAILEFMADGEIDTPIKTIRVTIDA
jgi:hypothetical protein